MLSTLYTIKNNTKENNSDDMNKFNTSWSKQSVFFQRTESEMEGRVFL